MTNSYKVLVTGSNGFVGKALCSELQRQGNNIVAVTRSLKNSSDYMQNIVVESIDGANKWSKCLEGVDIVIHLAARVHVMNDIASDPLAEFRKVNVEGTINLASQAATAGVKRFIFISTIGVNGSKSKEPFNELALPDPHNAYALSKSEAELGLQEVCLKTGMEYVIIRPPMIYGLGAPGNYARMITVIQRQWPLPLGSINNKRSFIYIRNLVSVIMECLKNPSARNQIFLVSDGQDISTTELLKKFANALNVKAYLIPFPKILLEISAFIFGRRHLAEQLCSDLQIDITKVRELLSWTPPYTADEGIQASVSKVEEK